MLSSSRNPAARSLAFLHPAFLLTGILHASGGPLLPSLAAAFALNDNQSGLIFLMYFAGTSLGAVLCTGHYARLMIAGFAVVMVCCGAVVVAPWPLQLLVFAALGIGVGLPMSAVSLFVGRHLSGRSASTLVLLNFTWSVGALIAPLMAARVLTHHSFRLAYAGLAIVSFLAAAACWFGLRDEPDSSVHEMRSGTFSSLRTLTVFATAAFLQVGIENTAAAWLTTYILRTTSSTAALAASLSAFYWSGYLVSRAASSFILLRVEPSHVLRVAVPTAFVAAIFLYVLPSQPLSGIVMFLLGAACAPIYPLIVAGSFSRGRPISETRWVLAAAGVGGSVIPWLTGWISAQSNSIRNGILTLPAALVFLLLLLPSLSKHAGVVRQPVS